MKALVMLRFLALELNFYHVGGRSGSPPKKLIFREKNKKISTENSLVFTLRKKKISHNSNFIIFSQMKALVMLRFLALELNFYHVGGRSGSPPKKLIFREKNKKISTEIS